MKKLLVLLFIGVLLSGCSADRNDASSSPKSDLSNNSIEKKVEVKAVYLVAEKGGSLSETELKLHPEVVTVHTQKDLENAAGKKVAIWIDKDSVDVADKGWLRSEPQRHYPVAIVGYNNALYSFRDRSGIAIMRGPHVDWSKVKLEPGFSVYMVREETSNSRSLFLKGYDKVPTVQEIIDITNQLLEGKFPS